MPSVTRDLELSGLKRNMRVVEPDRADRVAHRRQAHPRSKRSALLGVEVGVEQGLELGQVSDADGAFEVQVAVEVEEVFF